RACAGTSTDTSGAATAGPSRTGATPSAPSMPAETPTRCRCSSSSRTQPFRSRCRLSVVPLLLAVVLQQPTQPAQAPAARIPVGVGDPSPFRRLPLPAPNEIRTGSGTPGPRYWQQRVDYTIRATLDTGTHSVSGSETIRYTNHSPDSLRYLWL